MKISELLKKAEEQIEELKKALEEDKPEGAPPNPPKPKMNFGEGEAQKSNTRPNQKKVDAGAEFIKNALKQKKKKASSETPATATPTPQLKETIAFGEGPAQKSSSRPNQKKVDAGAEFIKRKEGEAKKKKVEQTKKLDSYAIKDGPFKGKLNFSLDAPIFDHVTPEQRDKVKKLQNDYGYTEKEAAYISGIRPQKRNKEATNVLHQEYEFATELPSQKVFNILQNHFKQVSNQERNQSIKEADPEKNLTLSNIKATRDAHEEHLGDIHSKISELKSSPEYQGAGLVQKLKMIQDLNDKYGTATKIEMARKQEQAEHANNKDLYSAAHIRRINDLMTEVPEIVDSSTAAQSVGTTKEDGSYGMSTFGTGGRSSAITNSSEFGQKVSESAKKHEAKLSPAAREAMEKEKLEQRGDSDLHEGMTEHDRIRHYNRIIEDLGPYGIDSSYKAIEDPNHENYGLPGYLPRGVKRKWEEHKGKFPPQIQALHQKTLDYINEGKGQQKDEMSKSVWENDEDDFPISKKQVLPNGRRV